MSVFKVRWRSGNATVCYTVQRERNPALTVFGLFFVQFGIFFGFGIDVFAFFPFVAGAGAAHDKGEGQQLGLDAMRELFLVG